MADHLLDSGILIRQLRGTPGYAALLKRLSTEGELYIASLLAGPDAVIAASALRLRATLVTTNAKHFPLPKLRVLAADLDGVLHSLEK